MFNIAKFSGNLNKYGTLQTNKFLVEVPPPRIFAPSAFEELVLYRASSARIPGVALDLQRVFRYGIGPEQKFPTSINFTDININFIDTAENEIWKRFSDWFTTIFDYTGTSGGNQASYLTEYKQYYTSDVKLYVFDNEAELRNIIILKEAFPTTLSEVGVSWSENNKLYEFSVGFTFREWYYSGYNELTFNPGAVLGPAITSAPTPRRVESPRPPETPRAQEGNLNPGGFTPQAQQIRRENFGQRGRAQGFYGSEPPQEPPQ